MPLEKFSAHIKRYNNPRILTGSVADAYRYNLEGWAAYMKQESLLASPYLTWVLDWECADFGSPEQDLAYIKPNIEELIEWSTFIEHYQAHGGRQNLNPEAMKFGTVYSALRTNLAGNRGTYNLQAGRNLDLRYIMVELGFTQSFMGVALGNAK